MLTFKKTIKLTIIIKKKRKDKEKEKKADQAYSPNGQHL